MKFGEEPDKVEAEAPRMRDRERLRTDLVSFSVIGLFVLALGYSLLLMRPALLPIVLALLVSLILQPIHNLLRKARIPRLIASTTTVALLMGLLGFVFYQIAVPGGQWTRQVDYETVSMRIQEVFRPVKEVQANLKEVADRVEEATRSRPVTESGEEGEKDGEGEPEVPPEKPPAKPPESSAVEKVELLAVSTSGESDTAETVAAAVAKPAPEPVVVEIREDPMTLIMGEIQDVGLGAGVFLLLVLFMLAYGKRIVQCLSENEVTELILERVGREVSRYLFTITVINACLGIVIGAAMWVLGMPNPALWGLLAMFLNFIPYVGALVGSCLVFLVAAASFDAPGAVIPIPLTYFILTLIEGNFVTPVILGERFKMNPLVVVIWIIAWGAFWGVAGVLIAMPALVCLKIASEITGTLDGFRRLLRA